MLFYSWDERFGNTCLQKSLHLAKPPLQGEGGQGGNGGRESFLEEGCLEQQVGLSQGNRRVLWVGKLCD